MTHTHTHTHKSLMHKGEVFIKMCEKIKNMKYRQEMKKILTKQAKAQKSLDEKEKEEGKNMRGLLAE